jgi:putative oxidoreductase
MPKFAFEVLPKTSNATGPLRAARRRSSFGIDIMTRQTDTTALTGRIFLAILFLMSGISKVNAPAATIGYIEAMGLPAPVDAYFGAVAVEVIGSLLLIAGYRTRIVAAGMAVFTLLTALLFHNNFADQNQMIHFMKNIAIMGGLLQVAAFGAGRFSLDHYLARPAVRSVTILTAAE